MFVLSAVWRGRELPAGEDVRTHDWGGEAMKTYEGKRNMDGLVVTVDGRPLPEHYEVKQFTKWGFEWTYEGASPQQLALAILYEQLGDRERAIRLSEPFMKRSRRRSRQRLGARGHGRRAGRRGDRGEGAVGSHSHRTSVVPRQPAQVLDASAVHDPRDFNLVRIWKEPVERPYSGTCSAGAGKPRLRPFLRRHEGWSARFACEQRRDDASAKRVRQGSDGSHEFTS